MARNRSGEVSKEVYIDVSDVLDQVSDEALIEECEARDITVGDGGQPLFCAEFLEDLARTIELGRPMDVSERRMAALRLREMIAPDNKRSSVIARKAA